MTNKIATALAAALLLASTGFAVVEFIDRAALTSAGTYQADKDGDALMAKMHSGMD
jgi:hypothetical protein